MRVSPFQEATAENAKSLINYLDFKNGREGSNDGDMNGSAGMTRRIRNIVINSISARNCRCVLVCVALPVAVAGHCSLVYRRV